MIKLKRLDMLCHHCPRTLILIAAIACSCDTDRAISEVDSRIIIVDIREADRAALVTLFNGLNRCKPRIVGLDVVLSAKRVSSDDSTLAACIKKAGNVIVLDVLHDEDNLQREIAHAAYKVAYSTRYWEGDEFYCPLAISEGEQLFQSMALALVYDSTELIGNFIKAGGNVTWPIQPKDIYQENYEVISIDSVGTYCASFNNKIVVVGVLRENEFRNRGKKVIRPFLTASSISYIIDYASNSKLQLTKDN